MEKQRVSKYAKVGINFTRVRGVERAKIQLWFSRKADNLEHVFFGRTWGSLLAILTR